MLDQCGTWSLMHSYDLHTAINDCCVFRKQEATINIWINKCSCRHQYQLPQQAESRICAKPTQDHIWPGRAFWWEGNALKGLETAPMPMGTCALVVTAVYPNAFRTAGGGGKHVWLTWCAHRQNTTFSIQQCIHKVRLEIRIVHYVCISTVSEKCEFMLLHTLITCRPINVWQYTDRAKMSRCHRHQNRRLCLRPHSHESVIFPYFWHS